MSGNYYLITEKIGKMQQWEEYNLKIIFTSVLTLTVTNCKRCVNTLIVGLFYIQWYPLTSNNSIPHFK